MAQPTYNPLMDKRTMEEEELRAKSDLDAMQEILQNKLSEMTALNEYTKFIDPTVQKQVNDASQTLTTAVDLFQLLSQLKEEDYESSQPKLKQMLNELETKSQEVTQKRYRSGTSKLPLQEFLLTWDQWNNMSFMELFWFETKLRTWVSASASRGLPFHVMFDDAKYSHPDYKPARAHFLKHWKDIPWIESVESIQHTATLEEHRIKVKRIDNADDGMVDATSMLAHMVEVFYFLKLKGEDTKTIPYDVTQDLYQDILKPLGFLVSYTPGHMSKLTL